MLQAYQNAGYAVVSCNYPFLSDDIDHLEIARHCARAVQFVRSKATDWNIDPHRLCCGGVSAGALISEFLAYHDNFADPSARDVISRRSSRPAVVISIMQPRGTEEFVLRFMDKGEAPIFIYSDAKPSDRIHPPQAAIEPPPTPGLRGKGVEGMKKGIASNSRTDGVIWIDRDPCPGG